MTLATHELGDPARPPLVFLHALGVGTSGCYVAEIAPLLRRRVIGIDAPGSEEARHSSRRDTQSTRTCRSCSACSTGSGSNGRH